MPREVNKLPEGVSDFYKVVISSSKGGRVEGWMPDQISIRLSADWDTPLAPSGDSRVNLLIQEGTGLLEQLGMFKNYAKRIAPYQEFNSIAVWSGSSPLVVSMQLEFIASEEGQALRDVVTPVRTLMKMLLPGKAGYVLTPPGPDPLNALGARIKSNEEVITVTVGKFLRFNRVIVTDAQPTFKGIVDSTGLPLRASVSFEFRTSKIITKQELDSIIGQMTSQRTK